MFSSLLYKNTEWCLPKGRIKKNESEKECAIREFNEETSIDTKYINVTDNYIEEYFYGTDSKKYYTKYFISYIRKDLGDVVFPFVQNEEVKDIRFFSYKKALNVIRPYRKEMKSVIHNSLKHYK